MVEGSAGGEGVADGKYGATIFEEGESYDVVAGDDEGGLAVLVDSDDASLAAKTGGDVEVAIDIESHTLSATEALIEDGRVAVAVDGVDGLIG